MGAMVAFGGKKIILTNLCTGPRYKVSMFRNIEDIQP